VTCGVEHGLIGMMRVSQSLAEGTVSPYHAMGPGARRAKADRRAACAGTVTKQPNRWRARNLYRISKLALHIFTFTRTRS